VKQPFNAPMSVSLSRRGHREDARRPGRLAGELLDYLTPHVLPA